MQCGERERLPAGLLRSNGVRVARFGRTPAHRYLGCPRSRGCTPGLDPRGSHRGGGLDRRCTGLRRAGRDVQAGCDILNGRNYRRSGPRRLRCHLPVDSHAERLGCVRGSVDPPGSRGLPRPPEKSLPYFRYGRRGRRWRYRRNVRSRDTHEYCSDRQTLAVVRRDDRRAARGTRLAGRRADSRETTGYPGGRRTPRRGRSRCHPDPLTPGLVLVFVLCLLFPLGVLAWRRFQSGESNLGLAAPFLIIGGTAIGVLVANATGFAGPEPWLDWQFVTSAHSRHPEEAGLYPAIIGSFFIMMVMAVFAFPVSIGAAIYLEEYAPSTGWRGRVVQLIQVNIANLAGVPSVVYGLLGLAIIARALRLGTGAVTTAAFTLGLLIMPITIISAQEAIRAVPDEHRQASYAMGASDWHTLRRVVLPEALPGILTGTILSLGRAIGETAPLIMIGAATTVYSPPTTLNDSVSAMPMQIFAWAGEFIADFRTGVLSAGVLTLLLAMLSMNAVAILIRNRYEQEQT
ncbi:phosphate ABC transporter permease PtsA [Halobacteriales archaeon QH_2_65_14]|nr:MAG: phosphate ABC transporter permease PtsA [Halobacteriales archaeon QH_2_65_14]